MNDRSNMTHCTHCGARRPKPRAADRLITASSSRCFRACPRKYRHAYVSGLRPRITPDALRFGTLWHLMQEHRWIGRSAESLVADQFDLAKASAMLMAYDVRWADDADRYEVLGIERPFRAPLLDASGKRVRGWAIAGKMDGVLRERDSGQVLLLEHKTASDSLELGGSYWQRLAIDSQVSIYFDGCASLGWAPDACLYDVARKPSIKPLLATPVEKRKLTKDGTLYATQRDHDESPDEYRARCVEAMADDVGAYMARAPVVRLDGELAEAREDLVGTVRSIEACTKSGVWPRNDQECFAWGRCPFWGLCSGTGHEGEFTRVEDVHPELATAAAAPKES